MSSFAYLIFVIYLSLLFTNNVTCWRIVGGRPAKEGEFPYQVSLRRSFNDNHFCGGSIISSRHILTAAHCMFYGWDDRIPPESVSVVAGQIDHPLTKSSIYRNVSRITVHEGYQIQSPANDVAVIELSSALPVSSNILVYDIPMREITVDSGKCVVTGWGVEVQGSDTYSETLLAADVDIVEFSKCQEMYAKEGEGLFDGMLCAGKEEGGKDACQGDSGGSLVCEGLLTGVVSTGIGCGDADFPGIYSDVAAYFPWIKNVLEIPTIETTPPDEHITPPPLKQTPSEKYVDATTPSTANLTSAPIILLPFIASIFVHLLNKVRMI